MTRTVALLLTLCTVGVALADVKPGVPALIEQLKDRDEIVRLKAAKTLGKLGADAKDAIPALTEALKDADEDVRAVAKQALAKITAAARSADTDESIKLLTRHLRDSRSRDNEVRERAIRGLAKLLKHDDDIVRSKAARGLGDAGIASKGTLKELNDAAKDTDELVRREARKAIGKVEAAIAQEKREQASHNLEPLLKKLKDRSPATRLKGIEGIADLGADGVGASEALINALNDRMPAVQQAALDALEKVNPPVHKPVVTLLVDRDYQAKKNAVAQLGSLGSDGKPAIPLLIRFYHTQAVYDPRTGSHLFSIGILDALKAIDPESKDFVALLLNALPLTSTSFGPNIQVGGRLPGHVVVDSSVRSRAIVIAGELVKAKQLEPSRVVKPLVAALNDTSCRIQAINALGELGIDAKDAIPALTRLKVDPTQATREAATAALKKIQ